MWKYFLVKDRFFISICPGAGERQERERERNWQNMFIISPICYPAVHSLDVTTFSYCCWIVHSHFDTEEGNYFFVLWNYKHLTFFSFCLTEFGRSYKYSTFVSDTSDNMIFSNPGCVSPLSDRVLTSRGWLVGTSVTLTANISGNPNIIEYDELYLHHFSCKLSRPPASH